MVYVWQIQTGYKTICIEGDNSIVMQALIGSHHIPWQIKNIIKMFKHELIKVYGLLSTTYLGRQIWR